MEFHSIYRFLQESVIIQKGFECNTDLKWLVGRTSVEDNKSWETLPPVSCILMYNVGVYMGTAVHMKSIYSQ